jgi:hypothetical protein
MKRNTSRRLLAILAIGFAVFLAGCGSDDDSDSSADEATETDETTPTSEAEEADAEAEAADADADEAEEAAPAEGTGIGVILNDEFEILLDSDIAAGSATFNVSNEGPDFPHALTIVRAASIDDLPINPANGAVDTDAMDPADIIGSTSVPMASGVAEDLTVDLEAGDYVFFCPIQDETRSHVGAGQIISVSVGG